MIAAVQEKAAEAKTAGGGDGTMTTDGGSTESTVLQKPWSDVDNQNESEGDVRPDGCC